MAQTGKDEASNLFFHVFQMLRDLLLQKLLFTRLGPVLLLGNLGAILELSLAPGSLNGVELSTVLSEERVVFVRVTVRVAAASVVVAFHRCVHNRIERE